MARLRSACCGRELYSMAAWTRRYQSAAHGWPARPVSGASDLDERVVERRLTARRPRGRGQKVGDRAPLFGVPPPLARERDHARADRIAHLQPRADRRPLVADHDLLAVPQRARLRVPYTHLEGGALHPLALARHVGEARIEEE